MKTNKAVILVRILCFAVLLPGFLMLLLSNVEMLLAVQGFLGIGFKTKNGTISSTVTFDKDDAIPLPTGSMFLTLLCTVLGENYTIYALYLLILRFNTYTFYTILERYSGDCLQGV